MPGEPLSFRWHIVLTSVALVATVILTTSAAFVLRHRLDLNAQMQSQSTAMRDELGQRGAALVHNLALVSERALATMDYSFLAEAVTLTAAKGSDVVYAMAMDTSGRVLVASDPNLPSQTLTDAAAQFAMAQTEVRAQEVQTPTVTVTEVVAPLRVGNKPWGCLRVGMSQAKLTQSLADLQERSAEQDRRSMLLVAVVAGVMLALASGLALVLGQATTRPLMNLLAGVERLGHGDMNVLVQATGAKEFRRLSETFNGMTRALSERERALQDNMRELALARDKAEESARIKGEFLANMSHELRTPLNAIINVPRLVAKDFEAYPVYACKACHQVFQRDGGESDDHNACPKCGAPLDLVNKLFYVGEPDETTRLMKRMMQSSSRLLNLVNDLLDFSKLEAGKVQLYLAAVDVGNLMQEMRDTMAPLAEDKKITLILNPPIQAHGVHADPVKLMQVLVNLVSNAIKFTPQGGRISVSAEKENDSMHFAVQDSGVGIPPDKFHQLFESFRQLDNSHTRAHQGTGLGLAICKRLLDLHQGKIWVESTLGQGATFHFTVPLEAQTRKTGIIQPLSLNVMVVDDNFEHLDLARNILQRSGMQVSTVQDATRAIGQVHAEHPDCIVLDVMMPHQSGLSLLRQLKENRETSHIPILVSTAYLSNREVVERLGGKWLPKPWHESTFAQKILQEMHNLAEPDASEEPES